MIPDIYQNRQMSFRMMPSCLIGLPSPAALRSDKFPGVRIGLNPVMGNHCIIFGNVFIGNQFRCGDNVMIRDNSSIGDEVTIGNGSFVDTDVVIADGVTVGENVWILRSTWIGHRVVIGSDVRFLTDPVAAGTPRRRCRGIILEDGCSIGKDAVISPGVCIGAGARVDDFAVVTEDVPAVYNS